MRAYNFRPKSVCQGLRRSDGLDNSKKRGGANPRWAGLFDFKEARTTAGIIAGVIEVTAYGHGGQRGYDLLVAAGPTLASG